MTGSSITVTPPDNTDRFFRPIQKWQIDWVSDSAAGTVSIAVGHKINGTLVMMMTDPSGGGTAPTDNYDIELLVNGADILGTAGQNRDTANTEIAYPQVTLNTVVYPVGPAIFDDITVSITNAGNSKQGTIYLYVR